MLSLGKGKIMFNIDTRPLNQEGFKICSEFCPHPSPQKCMISAANPMNDGLTANFKKLQLLVVVRLPFGRRRRGKTIFLDGWRCFARQEEDCFAMSNFMGSLGSLQIPFVSFFVTTGTVSTKAIVFWFLSSKSFNNIVWSLLKGPLWLVGFRGSYTTKQEIIYVFGRFQMLPFI